MMEKSKRIEELKEEVKKLKNEIEELERENSGYFIGVYKTLDGDYSDDNYCRLGFISEAKAKEEIDEIGSENGAVSTRYFEVSKEDYDKFMYWGQLDNLIGAVNLYNPVMKKNKRNWYISRFSNRG